MGPLPVFHVDKFPRIPISFVYVKYFLEKFVKNCYNVNQFRRRTFRGNSCLGAIMLTLPSCDVSHREVKKTLLAALNQLYNNLF